MIISRKTVQSIKILFAEKPVCRRKKCKLSSFKLVTGEFYSRFLYLPLPLVLIIEMSVHLQLTDLTNCSVQHPCAHCRLYVPRKIKTLIIRLIEPKTKLKISPLVHASIIEALTCSWWTRWEQEYVAVMYAEPSIKNPRMNDTAITVVAAIRAIWTAVALGFWYACNKQTINTRKFRLIINLTLFDHII